MSEGIKNHKVLKVWEYKFLYQGPGVVAFNELDNELIKEAKECDPADLQSQVEKLGEEGWELIFVAPHSNFRETNFTTAEAWVFKRPKHRVFLTSIRLSNRTEAKKFSPKAHESLKKDGYLIYLLQGKSLEELHYETGEPILDVASLQEWSGQGWVLHDIPGQFWIETSSVTEVAIKPKQIVLPNSNDKSFKFHQEMVEEFSEKISKDIKGIKAIIGEASNYIELALLYRKETGLHLFKKYDDFFYTATKTLWGVNNEFLVEVGEYSEGLYCSRYDLSLQGKGDTYILPLIVPI